ncbi:lytic transglycosylase domain-containing protein [Novosphingobium sp.]|uniref:lytic transglycosylase domain-containing protein n=1 Tax=Novosphingobium sp. TaxID=1874826 RepID=UPI0035AFD2C2
MSQTVPNAVNAYAAAPARPDVQGAIANASAATGIDFSYLLGQARIESSLDPAARASTSSAAGLFQFTSSTWLQMVDRHGAEYGLGWAAGAIDNGKVADPAMREQILALRFDPQISSLMAAELASENKAALTGVLGREPDSSELYMAHFLGAEGAGRFLTALAADPTQSAAAILPRAAMANRAIFYTDSGAPRSVGEVMDLMRTRMAGAMGDGAMPAGTTGWAAYDGQFYGGQQYGSQWAGAPAAQAPARPSMAETLAATFGPADGAGMPGHVRSAYGKLQAFGL